MTDIALIAMAGDRAASAFDLMLDGPDLQTDDGLRTAIYISWFTDGQALPDDVIPDGSTDRRGFWGDAFSRVPGDLTGSRLWLLSREKITEETLKRAEDYGTQALRWLIEDGVAASVAATAQRQDPIGIALSAVIIRPDGRVIRFDNIWRSHGLA